MQVPVPIPPPPYLPHVPRPLPQHASWWLEGAVLVHVGVPEGGEWSIRLRTSGLVGLVVVVMVVRDRTGGLN